MDQYRGRNSGDSQLYGFLRKRDEDETAEDDIGDSGQHDAHEYFLGIYGMLRFTSNHLIDRVRYVPTSRRLPMTDVLSTPMGPTSRDVPAES